MPRHVFQYGEALSPGGLQAPHFLGAGLAYPGNKARFPGLGVKLVKGVARLAQFGNQAAGRTLNNYLASCPLA
jgi:hypothetical protein